MGCRDVANLWENDFSERMGAMMAKELRQGLRRGSFVIAFLVIQLLAILFVLMEGLTGETAGIDAFKGLINPFVPFASGPFWVMAWLVCGVLLPLTGLFLMTEEMEDGNRELLQLTPLDRWQVVTGKFVSLWSLSGVALVSLLPYAMCRYLLGGTSWWNEACCFFTTAGMAALISAGGIGASAFRNWAGRIAVFCLFCGVAAANSGIVLGSAYGLMGPGLLYHFSALASMVGLVVMGLAVGRAQLRLSTFAYESNAVASVLAVLLISPFAVGTGTLATLGFGGGGMMILLAGVLILMDRASGEKWLFRRLLVRRAGPRQTGVPVSPESGGEETVL